MSTTPPQKVESRLPEVPWRGERVSRIILGTVQLGMDYGIANVLGQPDQSRATAIVEAAWTHGVRYFDTAQVYGNSEAALGRALRDLGVLSEARIASKLSVEQDPLDLAGLRASIERTFDHLETDRLWCMMLHQASWFDSWDRGLGELLRGYRAAGRFQHLGVSLNSPSEAPRSLDHPDIDVLQVACNAWDRRMVRLGVLDRARESGRLCCVRSIYLKGLLVLPPGEVATRLPAAREAGARWYGLAARFNLSPVEMAVRFGMTLDAPLVIGAEAPEQVIDTVRLAGQGPLSPDIVEELARTLDPVVNDAVLTPRRWEDMDDALLQPKRRGS